MVVKKIKCLQNVVVLSGYRITTDITVTYLIQRYVEKSF